MRVLIVGAGIAGLTLALCLRRRGYDPVVIERAPRLRGEGYMIDFFGSGYDAAERLRLLDALETIHYPIPSLGFIAPDGSTKFTLAYPEMRKRLFDDRHFNFMRGDLERVLQEALGDGYPIRFGVSIEAFADRGPGTLVTLTDGSTLDVDLVVGADGVHSRVRELAFGEERRFARSLGYHTAAYVIDDAALGQEIGPVFATLTVPKRQVAVYPIRGGRVATFWIHRADGPVEAPSRAAALRELRQIYGGLGWLVPRLLEGGEDAASVYLDTVSQIEMPQWSRGSVVLVGDACQCVSLLAGQGASMAMGAAYVLADELCARPYRVEAALAAYEARIKPAIAKKQSAGRDIARWFVPEGAIRLAVRDAVLRASTSPIGAWVMKRQMAGESVLRS